MTPLYPLRFEPIFRRYLWGGRRLGSRLGKKIGAENDYAESWEIVDRAADQSVVTNGPLAGTTLSTLFVMRGGELIGHNRTAARFPLLLKFLDAHHTLSVQVHPNDSQAARLKPPDLGKTEAWVVLLAEPGSKIYAGLKAGCDRATLENELKRGTVENCLHSFEPQAGDCIFVPAGLVHALGAGLMVAEIQQSSDTTFRLFDWNRVDSEGKPRPLHIKRALAVIDYTLGPGVPVIATSTDRAHVRHLVTCDKFILDRWEFDRPQPIGGDGNCHIVAVLDGTVDVENDPSGEPLSLGESMLIPAACDAVELRPQGRGVLLDISLP